MLCHHVTRKRPINSMPCHHVTHKLISLLNDGIKASTLRDPSLKIFENEAFPKDHASSQVMSCSSEYLQIELHGNAVIPPGSDGVPDMIRHRPSVFLRLRKSKKRTKNKKVRQGPTAEMEVACTRMHRFIIPMHRFIMPYITGNHVSLGAAGNLSAFEVGAAGLPERK